MTLVAFMNCSGVEQQIDQSVTASNYQQTDIASAPLQTQKIAAFNLTIGLPKGWQAEQTPTLWIGKMLCTDSVEYCPRYVITKVNKKSGWALRRYALDVVKQLEEPSEAFNLVSDKEDRINGYQVMILDYKYRTNHVSMGGTTLLLERDSYITAIHFAAGNTPSRSYAPYRDLYTQIMQSIVLD